MKSSLFPSRGSSTVSIPCFRLVALALLLAGVLAGGCGPGRRAVRRPVRYPGPETRTVTPETPLSATVPVTAAGTVGERRIRRGSGWDDVLRVSGPIEYLASPAAGTRRAGVPAPLPPSALPEPPTPGDEAESVVGTEEPEPDSPPLEEEDVGATPAEPELTAASPSFEGTIEERDEVAEETAGDEDPAGGDLASEDLSDADLVDPGAMPEGDSGMPPEIPGDDPGAGLPPGGLAPPPDPERMIDILKRAAGLGGGSKETSPPTPPAESEPEGGEDASETDDARAGEEPGENGDENGDAGRYEDAFKELRAADRELRSRAAALLREAEALLEAGRFDDAKERALEASRLHPALAADVEAFLMRLAREREKE